MTRLLFAGFLALFAQTAFADDAITRTYSLDDGHATGYAALDISRIGTLDPPREMGTTHASSLVMPYATNTDLPAPIRRVLPEHAQDIYREAFNHAFVRYGRNDESRAHRIAWAAVKRRYVRIPDGYWIPREAA